MPDLFLGLPSPRLDWSDADVPHNLDHKDGYYSDEDGLAETRAVFLAGCNLPEAWKAKTRFTIGELGFGTGLNFLGTWDVWRRTRAPEARLHFLSIEAAPFSRSDLHRAHKAFTPLQDLSKKLRDAWPEAIKGVHRLCFDEDGIVLTLYFMDVDEALWQMDAPADSWFLDGFAPSRNQAMWSDTVFDQIARLSVPGTRAATFSVAGAVRRGLQTAGFDSTKRPGHGRKRERLEAVFKGPAHPRPRHQTRVRAPGNPKTETVLIIGGGIAGASAAHAFLRRNINVTIISKAGPGDEASGNPAALVSPRLDLEDTPTARFFRTAFHHAAHTYASLGPDIWSPCGLLRQPAHPSDARKFSRLVAAQALPVNALSLTGDGPGMVLDSAGMVYPARAIAAMIQGAQIIENTVCTVNQKDGQWIALDAAARPIARAATLVLALGAGEIAQTAWLHFQYLKGQITQAKTTSPYHGPALLADGYVLGLDDGSLLTGATFDEVNAFPIDFTPRKQDHVRNLSALDSFAPALAKHIDRSTLTGRVSIRATTTDQRPYVGVMIDPDDFVRRFHALEHGFLDPKAGNAAVQENLFVLMGLGSRGFALAPVLGEAIAAEALGEPSPLEHDAAQALHPSRVLERTLKMGL